MHYSSGNTRHSFVAGLRKGPALDELCYSCPDIPRQYEPFSTCCGVCVRRISTPHRSLWSSFPTSSTFGVLAKSAGIPESIGSKIGRPGNRRVARNFDRGVAIKQTTTVSTFKYVMQLDFKASFTKCAFSWRFFFWIIVLYLSRQRKSLLSLNWQVLKVCF